MNKVRFEKAGCNKHTFSKATFSQRFVDQPVSITAVISRKALNGVTISIMITALLGFGELPLED